MWLDCLPGYNNYTRNNFSTKSARSLIIKNGSSSTSHKKDP